MPVFALKKIAPVSKPEDTAQGATVEKESNLNKQDSTSEDVKTVEIDGPLSMIYAQALNVAFAKESAADGSFNAVMQPYNFDDSDMDKDPDSDLYVYAVDSDDLDKNGVGEHFDKLRLALDRYKGSETKKVLVIEHFNPAIKKRVAIEAMEDYAYRESFKIYHKRAYAIEHILNYMQSLSSR